MILLIGIPSEPPLYMVHEVLRARGAPVAMFNQRRIASCDLMIEWQNGSLDGILRLEGRDWRLGEISAVYARPMDDMFLPELAGEALNSPLREHSRMLHDLMVRWMDVTSARVVNRPAAMGSNISKPYQAQIIRGAGFEVPETLITSDPAEVLAFRARYGRLIYKSISGARSIVTELSEEDLDRLGAIQRCPTQFQQRVEGFDVRVHVIGSLVYATRARSGATDYRYARRQGDDLHLEAFDLPEELSARCINLTRHLGLAFSGIDLKMAPDGRVFCFEVNPSPAFSFYEQHTGQPIAQAVAAHLMAAPVRART